MDCNLPDSSVHGISQARILEWVATPSFRGSSQLRDWTFVSRKSPTLKADSLLLSHWGSPRFIWCYFKLFVFSPDNNEFDEFTSAVSCNFFLGVLHPWRYWLLRLVFCFIVWKTCWRTGVVCCSGFWRGWLVTSSASLLIFFLFVLLFSPPEYISYSPRGGMVMSPWGNLLSLILSCVSCSSWLGYSSRMGFTLWNREKTLWTPNIISSCSWVF